MNSLLSFVLLSSSILPTGQPDFYKLNYPILSINENNESIIEDSLISVNFNDTSGFTYFTFDGAYFDGEDFDLVLDVSHNSNTLDHILGYYILLDYSTPALNNYYFDYTYQPFPNGNYVNVSSDDMQQYLYLPYADMTRLLFSFSYNGTFTFGFKVGYMVNNGNYTSESEYNTYISYVEDYFNNLIYNDYNTLQNNYNSLTFDYNTLENNYNDLLINYNNLVDSYNGLSYNQIYNLGYNTGLTDSREENGVIMSLFTAVASVPLSILNSVMGPVLFGVPIVSILLTFLALALILWLIRRFL